jgi:hypothetical protein
MAAIGNFDSSKNKFKSQNDGDDAAAVEKHEPAKLSACRIPVDPALVASSQMIEIILNVNLKRHSLSRLAAPFFQGLPFAVRVSTASRTKLTTKSVCSGKTLDPAALE